MSTSRIYSIFNFASLAEGTAAHEEVDNVDVAGDDDDDALLSVT